MGGSFTVVARGRFGWLRPITVLALVIGLLVPITGGASAAVDGDPGSTLDPFTQAELDTNWEADRYFPTAGVTSVSAFGRDDVARIGIDTTDTQPGTFQRTEGIKTVGTGFFGRTVQVDLYLDPDWADKAVRAGAWVVGDDGTGARDNWFGIIEFLNMEPCPEPDCTNQSNIPVADFEGFRVYDSNIGWSEYLATPFTYGEWVTLEITLDAAAEQYVYSIDGVEVATAAGGSHFISEVFLNSYNFGLDSFPTLLSEDYAAHWHVGSESDITWTTEVVYPGDMNEWAFGFDSGTDGSGELVWGPGVPPIGGGSASFELGDAATGYIIGTQGHGLAGMPFMDITALEYSTYRTAGGAAQAVALQFNVDYDLTDATTSWQGRLVYEPYYTQTVLDDTWQTWDTLATGANWWSTGTPRVGDAVATKHCLISDPCTWEEVLSHYPDAGVHVLPLGAVILKAGSAWAGFEGSADQLKIATGTTGTLFDFDPFAGLPCVVDHAGGGDFLTITAALAQPYCTTIQVTAGSYPESPTITRSVTIVGAGDDGVSGTIVEGTVTVSADDVTLEGMRIDPAIDTNHGIVVTSVRENLTLEGITATGGNGGMRMGTADGIDGLTVSNSHFDGNVFGWVFFQSSSTPAPITNVMVTDTTFSNNKYKGIYTEALSNAMFDGITVANSGTDPTYGFNNGIDINLKFGTYANITIMNSTVTGSGLAGGGPFDPAGITIKARDDGGTYGANPATLDDVTLDHVTVDGGVLGIRLGEAGKDNATPTNVVITRSSIDGTSDVGLANATLANADGTCNWWGDASGPAGEGPGTGSSVSTLVDFLPWLESADLDGPCVGGFPVIDGIADIEVEDQEDPGEVVEYTPTATSVIDGALPVTCDPVSGSTFFIGETEVECQATDSESNTTTVTFTVTVLIVAGPSQPEQFGVVDVMQGLWYLRNSSGDITSFYFGNSGDYPIVGDWDCNGTDTPGAYRQADGRVYLRNSNSAGVADHWFYFGNPGDIPIAGDFDDDGCDTVSLYRPSTGRFYIINHLGMNGNGLGAADFDYLFGNLGDRPFAGDFDGDGADTMGLHRGSTGLVYYKNTHGSGIADGSFLYGNSNDSFLAGDWNANAADSPAVFRPGNTTFYFRYTNTQGIADDVFPWVGADGSWMPVGGQFGLDD